MTNHLEAPPEPGADPTEDQLVEMVAPYVVDLATALVSNGLPPVRAIAAVRRTLDELERHTLAKCGCDKALAAQGEHDSRCRAEPLNIAWQLARTYGQAD